MDVGRKLMIEVVSNIKDRYSKNDMIEVIDDKVGKFLEKVRNEREKEEFLKDLDIALGFVKSFAKYSEAMDFILDLKLIFEVVDYEKL